MCSGCGRGGVVNDVKSIEQHEKPWWMIAELPSRMALLNVMVLGGLARP